MTRENRTERASEAKEYVVLTLSRGRLRSELGNQVADQLSEADLRRFAETLGDFYLSTAKEDWGEILAESYGVDFED